MTANTDALQVFSMVPWAGRSMSLPTTKLRFTTRLVESRLRYVVEKKLRSAPMQADYVSSFLNLANVVMVRLSVLCLYRRIFTTQAFRRVTLGLGIVILLHALLLMVAAAFRCLPVNSIWDPSVKPTSCINYANGFLGGMIINALIDAILLCLPFVMIRGLQMPLQRKLALAGIFLLGAG